VAVKIIDCVSEPDSRSASSGLASRLASTELPRGASSSNRALSGSSGLSSKRPPRGMCAQVRREQGGGLDAAGPVTGLQTFSGFAQSGFRSRALACLTDSIEKPCSATPFLRAACMAAPSLPGGSFSFMHPLLHWPLPQAAMVEALLARSMGHPHIVTTFAHGVGVEVS